MRMIMGIPVLVLVWVVSISGDLWALSLENVATVVQINSCQDCEEVEQQNLAFIAQDTSSKSVFMYIPALTTPDKTFMNKIASKDIDIDELGRNLNKSKMFLMSIFSVSGDGDLQALPLENVATVVQINSCQDCEEVEQQNLAFIFQDTSSKSIFMYIPDLITSDKTFMNKIANMASVIQENFCVECTGVDQQNVVLVIQEIDVKDPLVNSDAYNKLLELYQSDISNITDVIQTNECIMCQNVDQINLLFIFQNIDPEDLFISTSEDITQDSLFIDSVDIAIDLFRRIAESNIQDVEWTQEKLKHYFVTVRPGNSLHGTEHQNPSVDASTGDKDQ